MLYGGHPLRARVRRQGRFRTAGGGLASRYITAPAPHAACSSVRPVRGGARCRGFRPRRSSEQRVAAVLHGHTRWAARRVRGAARPIQKQRGGQPLILGGGGAVVMHRAMAQKGFNLDGAWRGGTMCGVARTRRPTDCTDRASVRRGSGFQCMAARSWSCWRGQHRSWNILLWEDPYSI